jgi:predicted transcriptional regulator
VKRKKHMIREAINKELKSRKLNVKEFAKLCGIRYGTILLYLNGTKESRTDILEVMFKELGWTEIR